MIPSCVGIILDGNRRWAKGRGLSVFEGHKAGLKKLHEILLWVKENGVTHLIVYAFSTENWNRSPEEVADLLNIFRDAVSRELNAFKKEGVRIRVAGDTKRFPEDLQEMIRTAEEETKHNAALTLVICLSYGGRAEIVHATEALIQKGKAPVTEKEFEEHVWTRGIPDPDLIIRPGGEKRLSGFLTWQSVYSELFFIDTLWPDFSRQEFEAILTEFANRERRRGK